MKTVLPTLLLLSWATLSAQAQFIPSGATARLPGSSPGTGPRPAFAAAERGAQYTRWISVQSRTNSSGRVLVRTNSFVELGAGINRLVGNQWVASRPLIEPVPGGAKGSQARHQVRFGNDLNTQGAIELTGPDGRRIRSHVLGLAYYDTSTGTNVLIAVTKSCQGRILSSQKQVVYADGFDGAVADVRYTYTGSGLEQDVIIRAQLPAPEAYGLNSGTTELQILTEYLDTPTRHRPGAADDEIEFGSMRMGRGHASPMGQPAGYLRVATHWAEVNGRHILIESVPAAAVRKATARLQPGHASLPRGNALGARQLPTLPKAAERPETMMLARATTPAQAGVVLDWVITIGPDDLGSYTFQTGTMYLISDLLTIENAVFEAGSVLKFGPCAQLQVSNLVSTATQYEPVTFTTREDSSIGWDVSTGDTNLYATK